MFWGFFHIIQATAYYKVLLSKYSFIVSQQKSEIISPLEQTDNLPDNIQMNLDNTQK